MRYWRFMIFCNARSKEIADRWFIYVALLLAMI